MKRLHLEHTRKEKHLISSLVVAICLLFSGPALAGSLCGNGFLDRPEMCDDGNNNEGDGCSRTCEIENGYQCTNPYVQLTESGIVEDGGFEFGPDAAWFNDGSIAPVVCNLEECYTEPVGPRTGAHWAQFGKIPDQQWQLIQVANFGSDAQFLKFDVMNFQCPELGSNDLFRLFLNDKPIWSTGAFDAACADGQRYRNVTINLDQAPGGPYADVGEVKIIFRLTSNTGELITAIDNIEVGKIAAPPVPSVCTLDSSIVSFQDFDGIDGPLGPPDFQQKPIGELNLLWGTTSDGFCGSNQNPPGNHTGEPGDAACIDSTFLFAQNNEVDRADQLGGNTVETYVCNAPVDLSFKLDSLLQLVVNYQPGQLTNQDFFGVWAGTEPFFGPLNNGTDTARLLINEPQGPFGQSPGVNYEFDISDLDGRPEVYVCFGYGNNSSGYAQVDTVILSSEGCIDDFEEDKILGCLDNCTEVSNPLQLDSDNDGYGNACDADIAKTAVALRADNATGNDCITNFADLFEFSLAIFTTPLNTNWNPDADFNSDGVINFLDLAIFRDLFLKPPGPSGVTNSCGT